MSDANIGFEPDSGDVNPDGPTSADADRTPHAPIQPDPDAGSDDREIQVDTE
jgi:hypothetical protein